MRVANITASRFRENRNAHAITGENAYIKIDYAAVGGSRSAGSPTSRRDAEMREQLRSGADLTSPGGMELVNIDPLEVDDAEPIVAGNRFWAPGLGPTSGDRRRGGLCQRPDAA